MSVDAGTISALREALDDEFRARATYRKVIEAFGPVLPFTNIVDAEERHIDALLRQFARIDVSPPADSWPGRVAAPASPKEACAAGVAAEIENGAMYTRLLTKVTDPQVREVMRNLQDASQTRHLPAFRRCLDRYR